MKHVMVFRLSAMGDVAMTVPVVRALVAQHPEVKVTVVSRPFFAPFFHDLPRVQFFGVDLTQRHKGFFGLLRLYKDLKALQIDAFADLHNVLRSKIIRRLFAISGVPTAFTDKGRKEKKELTRTQHKIFKPLQPMVERHATTLAQLGFTIKLYQKNTSTPPPLHELIEQLHLDVSKRWIGIAPFAQYETKVYPQDLMRKTLELLNENKQATYFLFGGGSKEIALLHELQKGLSQVVVVAGKLNFTQELLLIQHLDAMLAMDSGNAHIAAMYHIPTVTLWGQTHPYAGFAPYNQPSHYALVPDLLRYPLLPTSIYGNKKHPGYEEVMRSITPERIVKTINEIG